jgi:hypothetical protein
LTKKLWPPIKGGRERPEDALLPLTSLDLHLRCHVYHGASLTGDLLTLLEVDDYHRGARTVLVLVLHGLS